MKILPNLFKKKPPFNIDHPDIAALVEPAFSCHGRTYYRFIDEHNIPTGRYKWVQSFLRENELRMDLGTLQAYVLGLKEVLNPKKRSDIDLEKAWRIIHAMETRTIDLAFEPEGVRRLASVIYFDKYESLDGYDMDYNEKKRKFWKDHNVLDFFLTRPIGELLGLKNISITSLEQYINQAEGIIKDLNSGLQPPLSESSSENGKNP